MISGWDRRKTVTKLQDYSGPRQNCGSTISGSYGSQNLGIRAARTECRETKQWL